MKRNQTPNISTSSLRSSSRKNLKRNSAINSGLSSKRSRSDNLSKSTTKSKSTNNKESKRKKTIGSLSNQVFTCKGCKKSFRLYTDMKQFMMLHVKSNEECKKYYTMCVPPCNKLFYDDTNLRSHQSRCSKNSNCFKEFMRHKIMSEYSSSQVEIPIINSLTYPNNNVPSNLSNFNEYNKKLMFSKQHNDYAKFLPTMNFMNINIHHEKPISNKESIKGYSIMDPSMLKEKKDIVMNKIYEHKASKQIANMHNNDLPSDHNHNLHQNDVGQIVDLTYLQALSPVSDNAEKDNSQLSDISSSQSSSISNDFDNDSTTDNLCSNQILQNLLVYDSDNDIQIVNNIHIQNKDSSTKSSNDEILPNSSTIDKNESNNITEIPQQESVVIRSNLHFLKMQTLQTKELSNSICDEDYKECLELIQILMKHKIPVNKIYKEIIEWHTKRNHSLPLLTKASVLERAELRVCGKSLATKMKPIRTNLICPSGRHITVTSFDIDAIVFDILSDDDLMQCENFIFKHGNESNPFKVMETDYYGEFNTSEYYLETCRLKNINHEEDLLVPIQLYMDETTLDTFSHLQLHPLVLTLLIFNQKTRNLSMSWRTIAYIPNFDSLFDSKDYTVQMKHNDFHFCLRYLLNGVEKLFQSQESYLWKFNFTKYSGKSYLRNLKFVMGNILGDAKGANVLCSRFNNNTFTSHLARDCDVMIENADNHEHQCVFHKQKILNILSQEQLKNLSFRKPFPYSAFCNIDFGANCYGINGACAADPCHMFNKGVVERLPKNFFARITPKIKFF